MKVDSADKLVKISSIIHHIVSPQHVILKAG